MARQAQPAQNAMWARIADAQLAIMPLPHALPASDAPPIERLESMRQIVRRMRAEGRVDQRAICAKLTAYGRLRVRTIAFPFTETVCALECPDAVQLCNEFGEDHALAGMAAALELASVPLRRHAHTEADARRWFESLQAYPDSPWRSTPFALPYATGVPLLFDGEPQLMVYDDAVEYEKIDRLTDLFTEDERLRARRIGSHRSPTEEWVHDVGFRERVLRRTLPKPPTAFGLREAMWAEATEATGFKQSFAISVLRRLGAKKVLDISAGWGDRLIAALAARVDRYVAADPNAALRRGHDAIVNTLRTLRTPNTAVSIHYLPFEDAPIDEPFDVVFTSPPYFDFEVYTDAPGQSIQRFPELETWLEGWLFPALAKAWRLLEPDGHLAVHMCDGRIVEPMLRFASTRLPLSTYRGVLACTGSKPKARPVWVFRKGENPAKRRKTR